MEMHRQELVLALFQSDALREVPDHLWVGHQGAWNTQDHLKQQYFWPAIKQEVREFCCSCLIFQRLNKRPHPRVPLHPLALMGCPFEHIAMDSISPFPRIPQGPGMYW